MRIEIEQSDPDWAVDQRLSQMLDVSPYRTAFVKIGPELHIHTIGAGVLRDDDQLPDPGINQILRLLYDFRQRPTQQIATQRRDDAEGATVVAPLGYLQIGIVVRCQLDALWRQQTAAGIMQRRQVLMHGAHHLCIGVGTGHGQHRRVGGSDILFPQSQTTGNDHAAIGVKRFTDSLQ